MVISEAASLEIVPSDNPLERRGPDSTVQNDHSDRETPIVPEKPSEDGYNWRKYGQKNVKGNEFIRSYYKCSYHNCQVKKQVERSHDGRIRDTSYFGEHEHPIPQANILVPVPDVQVHIPDCHQSAAIEEKLSDVNAVTIDDAVPKDAIVVSTTSSSYEVTHASLPTSSGARDDRDKWDNSMQKRRKKNIENVGPTMDKRSNESRVVVETVSAVDIVNDGYRWRKYGQKWVKGNLNPRSYYRCSNTGCSAKKHVERSSYDAKVVITTYESKHDHDMPPGRTVLAHNVPRTAVASPNGIEKSESIEGNDKPEGHVDSPKAEAAEKQEDAQTVVDAVSRVSLERKSTSIEETEHGIDRMELGSESKCEDGPTANTILGETCPEIISNNEPQKANVEPVSC